MTVMDMQTALRVTAWLGTRPDEWFTAQEMSKEILSPIEKVLKVLCWLRDEGEVEVVDSPDEGVLYKATQSLVSLAHAIKTYPDAFELLTKKGRDLIKALPDDGDTIH